MKGWFSAVIVLVAMPCLAQSPTPPTADPSAHADLAKIAAALNQIELTLKQQAETQKADLLLKRLMFVSTQLAATKESLKRTSEEIRVRRNENAEIETRLAMIEKEIPPSDNALANQRARIADARSSLANDQDRINALEQEKVAAENEIQSLRREARDWQALLDRALTSPP